MRPILRRLLLFCALAPWLAAAAFLGVFLLRNPDARAWLDPDFLRAWHRVGKGMLLANTRYLEPERAAPADLAERALTAIARLDRYSAYLPASDYADFGQRANQTRTGIGADLQILGGHPVILHVHPNGGADAARLHPGDRLLAADGAPLDNLDLETVHRRLHRPEGAEIRLTVRRENPSDTQNGTQSGARSSAGLPPPQPSPTRATRGRAAIPTPPAAAAATPASRPTTSAAPHTDEPPVPLPAAAPPRYQDFTRTVACRQTHVPTIEDGRLLLTREEEEKDRRHGGHGVRDAGREYVGYIRVLEFKRHTAAELAKAIELHPAKNVRALILDLRDNPGGNIESAVDTVGLFTPQGTLVTTLRGPDPRATRDYRTRAAPVAPATLPLVLLVNARTASSAELVSGALQDHRRAIVIGTPTRGKHVAQTVFPLDSNDGLRLTTAQYYLPTGRTTRDGGIRPDIAQPLDWHTLALHRTAHTWFSARLSAEFRRLHPSPLPPDLQLSAALDYLHALSRRSD